MTKRLAVPLLAVLAVAAVVLAVALARRSGRAPAGQRGREEPVELSLEEAAPEPSLWIDVHDPAKAWRAVRANPWLARAMDEPLGQGLATGWAGFLSTRGSELSGAFEGAVKDLLVDRVLSDPFRLVFFSGRGATGTPALVVPRPSASAVAAFELLDGLARHGTFAAAHCPGEGSEAQPSVPRPSTARPAAGQPSAAQPAAGQPAAGQPSAGQPAAGQPSAAQPSASQPSAGGPGASPAALVSRWLIAEHALFAGRREGRLVLARSPAAVVQALCSVPPEPPPVPGVDLSISLAPEALGREAQLAGALLGLGPTVRLAFALEGDRLEPRGILGDLADPGRLEAAPPPDALLGLVPAEAGLVLTAVLRLPDPLTRDSLRQHLDRSWRGPTVPRAIAIVWNPRGDATLATEVALAWPVRDAALLDEAFTGPNRLERRRACGHQVLASTAALGLAMERACRGQAPSILAGAPTVVTGLRQATSLGVSVNLGMLLSRLVGDSFAHQAAGKRPPSPEVEAARRLLEELPVLGLRGRSDGKALVPGGFRS